jgi:CheY-like chemotaxis protein/anti-sigma regulatory factor (Ser/Thr protein kinase)
LALVRLSIPPNVAIQTQVEETLLEVGIGATALQQVMLNLVTNAVQSIGSSPGRVEITVAIVSNQVQIRVRDNGCGMDGATRARAFDPFFTTKPTGKGTGLGLAVVHGIVQSARGSTDVSSEVGLGITFTLLLPAVLREQFDTTTFAAPTERGHGEHILYIDDDEAVVLLIERTLHSLGYKVSGYTDAIAGTRAFAAAPDSFDIVVTDLSMPGMDGFGVAQAIKQVNRTTPIVLTSGYVRTEDQERAARFGIDHVILKPNTIDELGQVLDGLCRQLRSVSK